MLAAQQYDNLYKLLTGTSAWLEVKFERFDDGESPFFRDLTSFVATFTDPLNGTDLLRLVGLYALNIVVYPR